MGQVKTGESVPAEEGEGVAVVGPVVAEERPPGRVFGFGKDTGQITGDVVNVFDPEDFGDDWPSFPG